jgi:hypothetical protein
MIGAANRPLFGGWAAGVALQVPPPRFMPKQMALVHGTMMCVNHENRVNYSSLRERSATPLNVKTVYGNNDCCLIITRRFRLG